MQSAPFTCPSVVSHVFCMWLPLHLNCRLCRLLPPSSTTPFYTSLLSPSSITLFYHLLPPVLPPSSVSRILCANRSPRILYICHVPLSLLIAIFLQRLSLILKYLLDPISPQSPIIPLFPDMLLYASIGPRLCHKSHIVYP